MHRVAVVTLVVVVMLLSATPWPSYGQGRPRRVGKAPPMANAPPEGRSPVAGGTSSTPSGGDTVTLEGALVEVPVVVSDRAGHYIARLRQEDFLLLEDGKDQEIAFFSDQRVPIHVALVIDTSGSTRDTIDDIQDAAVEFINLLLPGDQVIVVSFADQVIVEQEFTNDRGRLERAIRRTEANGATRLYDAVYLTVAERLRKVDGRKAMIILSDGEDTASSDSTDAEAIDACAETDVTAYGIRFPESAGTGLIMVPNNWPFPRSWPQPRRTRPRRNIPGIPWPNSPFVAPGPASADPQFSSRSPGIGQRRSLGQDPFMDTIASNTGGTIVYADQVGDVRGLLARIAEELRHVYMIGYAPTNPLVNGGYRRITVQVARQPNLAIRHRLGYQAERYAKTTTTP